MSRVIDFALVRDCSARVLSVHGRHGSDHMLVIYEVSVANQTYRVGLWNVERDRKRPLVAQTILRLLRLLELDVMLLCETGDYIGELRDLEARGQLRMVAFGSEPGQANTCIVTRPGLALSSPFCPKMNSAGWITVRGGKTPPKYLCTIVVDGVVRFAVGQWPPTVHQAPMLRFSKVLKRRRGRVTRTLRGPVRRVLAYVRHSRRSVQFSRRHRGLPLFLGADYNNPPNATARYAPRWIADQAGMTIVAPKRGTHG